MIDILGSIDEKIENNEKKIVRLTDLGLLNIRILSAIMIMNW